LTFWRWTPVNEYVCPDCGYMEKSLARVAGSVDFIRQKWPKVKK
jgi:hypothetical protein